MEGAAPEAARRLELFLDHVLLPSTTSDRHLFDPAFAVLTDNFGRGPPTGSFSGP